MYHRSDQTKYYKKVLVPLELATRRRENLARAQRRCALALSDMRKALRQRRLDRVGRIIKKVWKNEWTAYQLFRQERRSLAGISDEAQCFSDKRIAVYTAVFGGYDRIWQPLFCPDNVDYFIFTDGELPPKSRWVKRPWEGPADADSMTPAEKNRYLKMHPHLLFGEYEYSVYVDGNILVTADLTALALQAQDFPVAMHIHKDRDCVYQEIDTCIEKGKDVPEALERQRQLLQQLGVPPHWGLLEAPVIARRHHDPCCIRIMESWWRCFCEGSRRDQIALIHCLWQLGIAPQTLGALGPSVMTNARFIWSPHKKP